MLIMLGNHRIAANTLLDIQSVVVKSELLFDQSNFLARDESQVEIPIAKDWKFFSVKAHGFKG